MEVTQPDLGTTRGDGCPRTLERRGWKHRVECGDASPVVVTARAVEHGRRGKLVAATASLAESSVMRTKSRPVARENERRGWCKNFDAGVALIKSPERRILIESGGSNMVESDTTP